MQSEELRTSAFPTGDLALLVAIILVGAWPFFAAWMGEAPPSWELGVGTVLVLVASLGVVKGLASHRAAGVSSV